MKKFLKRFEKLENKDYLPVGEKRAVATKRFERLEVNDKKIEIAIHDRQAAQESAPAGTLLTRMCPYCGAENPATASSCGKCRHAFGDFGSDYGGREALVKKCVCGAVNLKERKFCWVCGRDFSLWGGGEQVAAKQQNVIVVNIDGKTYRSDDPDLPPGIVALIEKIRRQGYSKELVDEWIRGTNEDRELRKEMAEQRIGRTMTDLTWQIIGLALGIAALIWIFWNANSSLNPLH